MKRKIVKRDKALLGAIIGSVAGLAGSAIGGAISKNSANAQYRAQQRAQNKQDTLTMAQNLSSSYGDQEYVDEFNKKIKFKTGGKMKVKNYKGDNKVSIAKKFVCGGRKKTACGGRKKAEWGAVDTQALLSGITSAGTNIIGSAIRSDMSPTIKQGNIFKGTPKEYIKQPDYIVDNANHINNDDIFRCGGRFKNTKRAKAKCGTKKS